MSFISSILKQIRRTRGRARGVPLLHQANHCRDHSDWTNAADLYLKSRSVMPWRRDLLVQAGNCFKEAGDLSTAAALYREASQDPALHAEAISQLHHLDEVAQQWWEGTRSSRSRPDLPDDHDRKAILQTVQGSATLYATMAPQTIFAEFLPGKTDLPDLGAIQKQGSIPDLALDGFTGKPLTYVPGLSFIQLGNFTLDMGGQLEPLLLGVAAVRIRLVAYSEATSIILELNGIIVEKSSLTLVQRCSDGRYCYFSHIWLDANRYEQGRHAFSVRAALASGETLALQTPVNISHTSSSFDMTYSDAFVSTVNDRYDDLLAEVVGRPAIVRQSAAMTTIDDVTSLVMMRVDQLGDLSASLPAMRRLRQILPTAHLVAVVAQGLSDIVSASGIVDEVIGLATEYSPSVMRRHVAEGEADRLRNLLHSRVFDVAIDLCPNRETRRLLLLANARYRVGFSPREFPFLDFGMEVISRDKANGHSTQPHSAAVLSLVEGLYLKLSPRSEPVPRLTAAQGVLEELGLEAGQYIVVHCGARHVINCWPRANFFELAALLHGSTGLPVVIFPDDDESEPAETRTQPGLMILGKVPLATFDMILSNARLMIGNDSGPKHLAATRGVWTASIHINRLNWNEWGQNGRGIMISKKVPCAGCGLNDERLCGKDVACLRSITVDEVFNAIMGERPWSVAADI